MSNSHLSVSFLFCHVRLGNVCSQTHLDAKHVKRMIKSFGLDKGKGSVQQMCYIQLLKSAVTSFWFEALYLCKGQD